MNETIRETINLLERLPEREQKFIFEVIQRLATSYRSEVVEFTFADKFDIDEARRLVSSGRGVKVDESNWEGIGKKLFRRGRRV